MNKLSYNGERDSIMNYIVYLHSFFRLLKPMFMMPKFKWAKPLLINKVFLWYTCVISVTHVIGSLKIGRTLYVATIPAYSSDGCLPITSIRIFGGVSFCKLSGSVKNDHTSSKDTCNNCLRLI